MASSLAAQLQKAASLNATYLNETTRKKAAKSYLFTGREADEHDLVSLHALGVNGLLQLSTINPIFRFYLTNLFSDSARDLDRTLLPVEQDAELNKHITSLTRLLGPYLLDGPAGKVIEWLVRRFRIHELNVPDILALFLPYHDTPHFQKMVTILRIKENTTWSFLIPYGSAAQSLPRQALVKEMLQNLDVARFVANLLPQSILPISDVPNKTALRCHRALLAFNTVVIHDYLARSKKLDEAALAFLLPSILEPLNQHQLDTTPKDALLASYVLLCSLSQKCVLTPKAVRSIVAAMAAVTANEAQKIETKQFISAVVGFCAPQEEVQGGWSDACVKNVVSLTDLESHLTQSFQYMGSAEFTGPLFFSTASSLDQERIVQLWSHVLVANSIPQSLVRKAAQILTRKILLEAEDAEADLNIRRLLQIIYQRYPEILRQVLDETTEDMEDEGVEVKSRAEQLTISLSRILSSSNGHSEDVQDALFAVTNADAALRAKAVKELVNSLKKPSLSDADKESVRSALISHVQDSDTAVLDALYNTDPLSVLSAFQSNVVEYINHLRAVLDDKPKRAILRTHITFLLTSFIVEQDIGEIKDKIFHEVIFPLLMVSKPRKKSAGVVWELIAQNVNGFVGSHTWLAGCVEVWKARALGGAEESEEALENMGRTTSALAERIADNIMLSNHFATQLSILLEHLAEKNTYTRTFAHLIARSLVSKLSGEQQLKATNEIIRAMNVENITGVLYEDMLTAKSVLDSVVNKPSSETTISLIQASILALVPTLCKPLGSSIDWFAQYNSDTQDRGAQYVQLMRTVYGLSAGHSTILVAPLFINLQDDCLLFLLGVCIAYSDEDIAQVALQHISAFLEAHLSDKAEKAIDFQTVVPALLVVLQKIRGERFFVLNCIDLLSRLTAKQFKSVYKFDETYGTGSDQIQYLDRDDYIAYITALAQHRPHFENDVGYLPIFHQLHLGKKEEDKKKYAEFKEHVLCWLLSHVITITPVPCKVLLLDSLRLVSHKVKAEMLHPLLLEKLNMDVIVAEDEEYTKLLLETLDASNASGINSGGPLYTTFKKALDFCFRPGSVAQIRASLVQSLEIGLFSALTTQVQVESSRTLLQFGSQNATAYTFCKDVISLLVQEVPLLVSLLGILQPTTDDADGRAPKRTRLLDAVDDSLSELSLFAEVLASKDLPGSIELISRTMDTLHHLVQYSSSAATDVNYIEQLLMTAMGTIAGKIDQLPNLSPSAVKLEVLVEVIRVTNNPQTSHQALLLIADLARLSAEAVLHNVMPVFTFMGSNVFHQDDSYSFQVVSKTVDSIVPVMVSFLKKEPYAEEQELYIRSREFLRTFTDAANHIPRHRRTKFFIHLVDVLGPDDFLAPLVMLLVDKAANRVARQVPSEAANTLSLPISILQHYGVSTRFNALSQLMSECERLVSSIVNKETARTLFLETPPDAEHAISIEATLSRQAQALLTYIGLSYKTESDSRASKGTFKPSTVATSIFTLITPETEEKAKEVCQTARASVHHIMEHMFVYDFVDTVETVLRLDKNQMSQIEAFNLIHARLPLVTEPARAELAPITNKIIQAALEIVSKAVDPQVSSAAFKALGVFGQTTRGGEEGSLTNIIPIALSTIKARSAVAPALMALQPLPSKVGPRMIPYVRDLISQCVTVLQESLEGVAKEAINLLQNLLVSIPTFWGSAELQKVVMYCITQSGVGESLVMPLVKNIAKRVPSKTLLPSLCQVWPQISSSNNISQVQNYFDLLTRAIRFSSKSEISSNLRSLFRVVLEGLEVLAQPLNLEIEAPTVLSAFTELTSKLSDVLFKPLFRRLHDWAFTSSQRVIEKQIVFCKLYHALQNHFKALMNPYMSLLLHPLIDLLDEFSKLSLDSSYLWSLTTTVLTESFSTDDGAFWREDRLRQIASPLVRQAPVCVLLSSTFEAKELLSKCLVNMTELMADDAGLKSLNLELLMHTRSEDARLRIFALTCSENLWLVHGGKLLGFSPETATFVAECAEDENDMVVKQAKKLKNAVESVAGAISGL